MEKGTSSSDKLLNFLKSLEERYETGGIWIAKKLGRRWSFFCGIQPKLFLPPTSFPLDEKYALFCENPELLERDLEEVKKTLLELLYEN